MTACTDDERRRVAERLRRLNAPSLIAMMNILDVGGRDMCSRLADLIEPPTQCPYYHSDRHYCSVHDDVVDRDALLALADEMEIDGAGALDDGDWCKPLLVEYARRIREALGVGDD